MAEPYRQSEYAKERLAEEDELAPWDAVEEPTREQLQGSNYWGETAESFGTSQAAQAQADPYAMEAQKRALQQMQERSSAAPTSGERLAFEQSLREQGGAMRGQAQASLQDLQARGQGGAGAETAALFGGAQAAANTASQQQTALNRAAQQRALSAMQMAGQAGGQMRQQSFGEQYSRGQATDYFSRKTLENRQGVNSRNMTRANQQVDNESQSYRDQADIRARTAAGRAGVHRNAAEMAGQKAQQKRDEQDSLIGGVASWAKGGL